jgi:hypothetical protein
VVGVVVEADGVVEQRLRAAHRHLEPRELRVGVVAAHVRPPLPRAADAARLGDDVRDLAGEAGDVELGAVDDLDAHQVGGGDLGQLPEHVVALARQALPLSSTLPVAWPMPRSCSASRITKPGTCCSMSSALRGE